MSTVLGYGNHQFSIYSYSSGFHCLVSVLVKEKLEKKKMEGLMRSLPSFCR